MMVLHASVPFTPCRITSITIHYMKKKRFNTSTKEGCGYYKEGMEECLVKGEREVHLVCHRSDYSFGLNKDPHDKQKGMLIAQTKY